MQEAKQRDAAVVLIGHVTKDGGLAGPRLLEHVVDTVLSFEGDRHHALRLLRAVKHRYGPTSELGVFEMGQCGLDGVADASGLFLADRGAGIPGQPSCRRWRPPPAAGRGPGAGRPVDAALAPPFGTGLDQGRLSLLVAVLTNRAGVPFADHDVYASVVGGLRLGEPGSDLGVCLALASAHSGVPLDSDLIACAEIGLGGELRLVGHTARRLAEAARLGFRRAVVPISAPEVGAPIELLRAASLAEALAVTSSGLARSAPTSRSGRPPPGRQEVGSAPPP